MGKDSPSPPDYTGAAEATAESSKENLAYQTYANRADQYSPWGSTTWNNQQVWDPATKQYVTQWEQDTALDPASQWTLDQQKYLAGARSELGGALMDRAFDEFGQPMDYTQAAPWAGTPDVYQNQALNLGKLDTEDLPGTDTPADVRNKSEQALYERSTSRLDPRWEQDFASKEAEMVNRGLRPGDEVWDREMANFDRSKTDAYQTATNEAIMGGGQEASRQFGMQQQDRSREFSERMSAQGFDNQTIDRMWQAQEGQNKDLFQQQLQQANYANQLRQGQLAEQQGARGQSLNEINALIAGQQVGMPTQPGYGSAGVAPGTDYTGAAGSQYSGALDQYSAQQAQMGGLMSGAATIAGMIPWSDRRLKQHITRIGEFLSYPFYYFQYIWGEWAFGVMADEVNPEAVVSTPSGFNRVDYGRLK